jgi:hypothetical protein
MYETTKRNFLTCTISDKVLQEIQDMLASADETHYRIRHLVELTRNPESVPAEDRFKVEDDPFEESEYDCMVKEGFVYAIKNNGFDDERVLRFANSLQGLRCFNSRLFLLPQEEHADCWKDAFKVPFEIERLDFASIFESIPLEYVYELLDLVGHDWWKLSFPGRNAIMRNQTARINEIREEQWIEPVCEKAEGEHNGAVDFYLDRIITEHELLNKQIRKIQTEDIELLSENAVVLLERIPFEEIHRHLEEADKYEEFLPRVGATISEELTDDEIDELLAAIEGLEQFNITPSLKLLYMFLIATHLANPEEH